MTYNTEFHTRPDNLVYKLVRMSHYDNTKLYKIILYSVNIIYTYHISTLAIPSCSLSFNLFMSLHPFCLSLRLSVYSSVDF